MPLGKKPSLPCDRPNLNGSAIDFSVQPSLGFYICLSGDRDDEQGQFQSKHPWGFPKGTQPAALQAFLLGETLTPVQPAQFWERHRSSLHMSEDESSSVASACQALAQFFHRCSLCPKLYFLQCLEGEEAGAGGTGEGGAGGEHRRRQRSLYSCSCQRQMRTTWKYLAVLGPQGALAEGCCQDWASSSSAGCPQVASSNT